MEEQKCTHSPEVDRGCWVAHREILQKRSVQQINCGSSVANREYSLARGCVLQLHIFLQVSYYSLYDWAGFLGSRVVGDAISSMEPQGVRVLGHEIYSLEELCHCCRVVRGIWIKTIDRVEASRDASEDIDAGFLKQLHSLAMSFGIVDPVCSY